MRILKPSEVPLFPVQFFMQNDPDKESILLGHTLVSSPPMTGDIVVFNGKDYEVVGRIFNQTRWKVECGQAKTYHCLQLVVEEV